MRSIYAEFHDGPHATPKPAESGAVFLGIKNITEDGRIDLSEIRHIAEEDLPLWTRRVTPQEGDIVFSYEATLHRYAMIPKGFHGCLGRRLALIRPNNDIVDPKFLFYYFFSHKWRDLISQKIITGSTVDRIPLIDFPKFEIDLPPLNIQRRIASTLSAYDDLIENNMRRIRILEQIARDLYQEWFVRFRFPGHESTNSSQLPEGWREGYFTDFVDVLSGGTPSTKKSEFWDGDIPFYSPKDAFDTPYVIETERNITKLGLEHCNSQLYPQNTVFITARGTVGKVKLPAVDMAMNQSCYALVAKDGVPQLFVYFLTLQHVNDFVQQATGAVFDTIIIDNFRRLKVTVPSPELLDNFAEIVNPIFNQIRNLQLRNRVLLHTRDLLLPRLISGEIDVSDLNIPIELEAKA